MADNDPRVEQLEHQNRQLKAELERYKPAHQFAVVSGISLTANDLSYYMFARYDTGLFSTKVHHGYKCLNERSIKDLLACPKATGYQIWFTASDIKKIDQKFQFPPYAKVITNADTGSDLKSVARERLVTHLNPLLKRPINLKSRRL